MYTRIIGQFSWKLPFSVRQAKKMGDKVENRIGGQADNKVKGKNLDLAEIRKEITKTDDEMARLFEQRMSLVGKVAEYKKANGLAVYDAKREEEVLQNGAARIKNLDYKSYYFNFQKHLMELSRKYQSKIMTGLRVAYCGEIGRAHV